MKEYYKKTVKNMLNMKNEAVQFYAGMCKILIRVCAKVHSVKYKEYL